MRLPVDNQHAFGVVVPDLPGGFSAGDSLDEAMAQAREAILLHLEGLLDPAAAQPGGHACGQSGFQRLDLGDYRN